MTHLTVDELERGMAAMSPSPSEAGTVDLMVRRPGIGARELIAEGELDPDHGLVGDRWGELAGADQSLSPDTQLTLMNSRVIALLAGERERWALAGDQLFVDLDLSRHNLPAGTRLALGTAIIEVTDQPHTGCAKFIARFGLDAMKLVNSPAGRAQNLRGLYARVVRGGTARTGDTIRKVASDPRDATV